MSHFDDRLCDFGYAATSQLLFDRDDNTNLELDIIHRAVDTAVLNFDQWHGSHPCGIGARSI